MMQLQTKIGHPKFNSTEVMYWTGIEKVCFFKLFKGQIQDWCDLTLVYDTIATTLVHFQCNCIPGFVNLSASLQKLCTGQELDKV